MGNLAWATIGLLAFAGWTGCAPASSSSALDVEDSPPNYEIACVDAGDCPESVALLVGLSGPSEPTRCTAALIGPRTAVTAGHCVAWELSRGGGCHDVWLGFASNESQAPKWVGCASIRRVGRTEGTLLAPDYAVLRLRSSPERDPFRMERGELNPGEVVQMVSITPHRYYDRVHEIRSRRCVIDDGGDNSPWAPVAPPTVRVLSSCPIHLGNSGAPLLDSLGQMRGLVHAGGPPYFAFGLMTESDRIPDDASTEPLAD